MNEWFEIVAEDGSVIGCATRKLCHCSPELLHRVVHVLIMDESGRWLLQKRSARKDIQPGKWDMSVGGQVVPGESSVDAAMREVREEMGIEAGGLVELYRYLWRSDVESELVTTFLSRHGGSFTHDPAEIDEARWWTRAEIEAAIGTGVFTPNFEEEYRRFNQAQDQSGR